MDKHGGAFVSGDCLIAPVCWYKSGHRAKQ